MNFLYNESLLVNMIKLESFSSSCVSESIKTKTYTNIILPIVSYVCETWSLTLRGKHRLLVFIKNRVLRKMFMPKRDDETGESRRLHNEGLSDLYPHQYYLGDQTKKNEIYERCSTCGGEERCIWDFGGET